MSTLTKRSEGSASPLRYSLFMLLLLAAPFLSAKPSPVLRKIHVDIPHWKIGGSNKVVNTVYVAAHARAPLEKALSCVTALEKKLETQFLFTFDGTYVPRYIKGTTRWSNHAHGTAIDINAHHKSQAIELVMCFEEAGWKWGGRWPRPDVMHFEWRGK